MNKKRKKIMGKKNLFLNALVSKDVKTENGAISNSTTNSVLVDQFGVASNYRNRDIDEVFNDQSLLWYSDKEMALRFPFYLRMITRKVRVHDTFTMESVQNGQGVRDEAFKRLLWFAKNEPKLFYSNIWLLPIVGSWKDLWTLMFYDNKYNLNVLDNNIIFELLKQGMECNVHVDLIKKFMPRIKSKSKLKTEWTITTNMLAKDFAKFLGISSMEYNKLKTSGTAHDFQKLISTKKFDELKWELIPGRALNLMVSSKFLENNNLSDKYSEWIMNQPVAKFTGYVHELYSAAMINGRWSSTTNTPLLTIPLYKKVTIDKQFDQLIKQAKENGTIKENVWCALDTSGSMGVNTSCGHSAMSIATSLGIFFSTLNEGAFHKNVIMFDNKSKVQKLNGTFTDMLQQIPYDAMGGTNFQSVVDEICRVRNTFPNIPLEEYPTTLLVVSDMEFNATNRFNRNKVEESNYEAIKSKMYQYFPSEFVDSMKFIWWNVSSRLKNFPSQISDGGTYMFSGYDGSIINMLLGEEPNTNGEKKKMKSMEEMVFDALNQDILKQIRL